MFIKGIFSAALSALALVTTAAAQVDGPFALYITSANPAWNNRYIHIAARTPYFSVVGQVASPSDIPAAAANFYIDSTSIVGGLPGQGQLVWGAQPPFGKLYFDIWVTQPSSNLQPLFGQLTGQVQGYSTEWGFLPNGKLHLGGLNNFHGLSITAPRFGGDVIEWKFGTGKPSNTSAVRVQIRRHTPA